MLTVELVENKLRKKLSKLKSDRKHLKISNKIDENKEIKANSISLQLSLNIDIDLFLTHLDFIFNDKLLLDNINTIAVKNEWRLNESEILRGMSAYNSFLVNNEYYVFYKVLPVDKIKTKASISKECYDNCISENNLNIELLDLIINAIELEGIIIEIGVLYYE